MSTYKIKNLNLDFVDGNMKRTIFNNAEVSFESGKMYAITGRSGSGKSSFVSIISGLLKPQSVDITYDDKKIEFEKMNEFRKENISIIFQNYNLIDYLNSVQNIKVATSIQSQENIEQEFINYVLDLVGINQLNSKKAVSKLSGGECQRVAIARALATDTPIIIADEPTGNLDVENEKNVLNLFSRIAKESNKILIIVTHSKEVSKMCDVVYQIQDCELKNGKTK